VVRATYYVFFDLDGSYWVVKVLRRFNRITFEEITGIVKACFPSFMCDKMLGKVATIVGVDIDYYMFMYIPVDRGEIRVVSGGLKPRHGSLVFIKGLRQQDIVSSLSKENKEIFYRDLFYNVISSISDYEKNCRETVESILSSFKDIVNNAKKVAVETARLTAESLGFVARPEAILLAETQLAMGRPPSPPPPSPPSPQPVPLWRRIVEKLEVCF
jgi:hypothetical protein